VCNSLAAKHLGRLGRCICTFNSMHAVAGACCCLLAVLCVFVGVCLSNCSRVRCICNGHKCLMLASSAADRLSPAMGASLSAPVQRMAPEAAEQPAVVNKGQESAVGMRHAWHLDLLEHCICCSHAS
jgi:hypothetical protein